MSIKSYLFSCDKSLETVSRIYLDWQEQVTVFVGYGKPINSSDFGNRISL